jgi:hypothetical protein
VSGQINRGVQDLNIVYQRGASIPLVAKVFGYRLTFPSIFKEG